MATGNYAHLTGTLCDNVIVLDPNDCGSYPLTGLVHIDGLQPQPGIGWTFDGTGWTPPPPMTTHP